MKLTLLGTGTSQGVPVIGCDCTVCTSDDPKDSRLRCAALLETATETIVIDVGPDFRQQMLRADVQQLDGVLITHEHNDHIIGMDDVRPFNFRQKQDMPVYAEARVQTDLRHRFGYVFAENKYPGAPSVVLRDLTPNEPIWMGQTEILPLRVFHGKLPILGFRVGDIAYLTDVKSVPEETRARLRGLKTLVTSALHFYEHHSHMNFPEALEFAEEIGAERTVFLHMSHRAGRHGVLANELPAGVELGYDGLVLPGSITPERAPGSGE